MTFYFLFLNENIQILNKSIGEKLKELRKTNGFIIEETFRNLNMAESTYLRMERGETATWTSKIDEICQLYNIEPEELILSKEKYVLISNHQKSGNTASNITINNISEKAFELFERIIAEKDVKIIELEKRLLLNK